MSALRTLASVTAQAVYDAINIAGNPDELDHLARDMWRCYGEGGIGDDDATFLSTYIEQRRPPGRGSPVGHLKAVSSTTARRLGSRFTSRQRQRSPDRKASRDRRRMLGGSSVLPPDLRCSYTEGMRAVLAIVAGEVKHHGVCDLPIDKIAALAGVCRTTAQGALHEARVLNHIKITERPQPGRKHLTNVLEIINMEWWAWIKRAPTAHSPIGSKPVNLVSTTKNRHSLDDAEDDAPVREATPQRGQPSKEAVEFAVELERIAGIEGAAPTSWTKAVPADVVQHWFDTIASAGACHRSQHPVEVVRTIALWVMKRRRTHDSTPPRSPRYFTPEIAKVAANCIRMRTELLPSTQRRAA